MTRQRQGLRVWELHLLDICSKLIVDTIKIRNKNSDKEKACEEQRLERTPSASNLSPHHNHLHHHPHPQFFSLSSTPRIIHLPKKAHFPQDHKAIDFSQVCLNAMLLRPERRPNSIPPPVQCVTITPSYWYLVSLHSPRNDQPDSPAHPLPLTLTFARQLQWERDSWSAFYDHC